MVERLSASGESGGGGASASVVALVRHRLIEYEVRYGLGLGRVEDRSLIQEKVSLGRPTSGRDGRECVRELEAHQEIVSLDLCKAYKLHRVEKNGSSSVLFTVT